MRHSGQIQSIPSHWRCKHSSILLNFSTCLSRHTFWSKYTSTWMHLTRCEHTKIYLTLNFSCNSLSFPKIGQSYVDWHSASFCLFSKQPRLWVSNLVSSPIPPLSIIQTSRFVAKAGLYSPQHCLFMCYSWGPNFISGSRDSQFPLGCSTFSLCPSICFYI
jgi:hypothetical protein